MILAPLAVFGWPMAIALPLILALECSLAALVRSFSASFSRLISGKKFTAHQLGPKEFAKRVGPSTMVIDVRDSYQRAAVGLFPFEEKWIPLSQKGRLSDQIDRARRNGKTLLIYDEVGKQVRWLQYRLEQAGVKKYYFMKGGAKGNEVRCVDGSWGADFYKVAPKEGDLVVRKHRYSAFSGTAMDNLLRRNGIRTTVVTGVSTNICVESTLREAFNLGYYVVVPRDCVASNNAELHEATLKNVEFLLGDVTSSFDLIGRWTRGDAGAASAE